MHYLIHYPRLLLLYGPLSKLSCMRFEVKHQYFKSVARKTRNFKNLSATLSRRHQLSLMYSLAQPVQLVTTVGGKNRLWLTAWTAEAQASGTWHSRDACWMFFNSYIVSNDSMHVWCAATNCRSRRTSSVRSGTADCMLWQQVLCRYIYPRDTILWQSSSLFHCRPHISPHKVVIENIEHLEEYFEPMYTLAMCMVLLGVW